MKSKAFNNGIRSGVIFGIVIIFLVLIGFTYTAPTLIGKLIGNAKNMDTMPMVTNLIIFLTLIGIWNGARASKPELGSDSNWGQSLGAGLTAGVVTGVLAAVLNYFIGSLHANEVDLRQYMVALSPESVELFSFQSAPLTGAIILLGLFTVSGLIGGLLAEALRKGAWKKTVDTYQSITSATIRSEGFSGFIRQKYMQYLLAALLIAVLLIVPRQWGSYWNYVAGTVGIYILLGLGMNIIIGLSGQLVIGYAAFFAIGAYTFALMTAPEPHGLLINFWIAMIAGIIAAAVSGLLLGLSLLGLRSDYLAIVTLGFGEIVRILIRSDMLTPLTAGPKGVRNIGGPTMFGKPFSSHIEFMYLIIIAVVVLTFITQRLQHSRPGRAWLAIREDETVAQATGIATDRSRLLALAIGAAFAGLGGALFASRNQFTGPEDHVLMVSINVICLVIVGGMGSIPGIFVGAFALKGVPELLREMENFRMLIFGALLVVMMLIRPEGLWPAKRPRIENYDEHRKDPPDSPMTETKVVNNGHNA